MEHVGRSGKERRMEKRTREGQGETDTKERAMSRREEAENKLELKANPESENQRKPEMKKKWSRAVRNHGLLISEVPIQ